MDSVNPFARKSALARSPVNKPAAAPVAAIAELEDQLPLSLDEAKSDEPPQSQPEPVAEQPVEEEVVVARPSVKKSLSIKRSVPKAKVEREPEPAPVEPEAEPVPEVAVEAEQQETATKATYSTPFPTASNTLLSSSSSSSATAPSTAASSSVLTGLKSRVAAIPSISNYSFDANAANPFGSRTRRNDDVPLPARPAEDIAAEAAQLEAEQETASAAPVEEPLESVVVEAKAPVARKPLVKKSSTLVRKKPVASAASSTDVVVSAPTSTSDESPTDPLSSTAEEPFVVQSAASDARAERPITAATERPFTAATERPLGGERPLGSRAPLDEAALEALMNVENPFGKRSGSISMSSPNRPIRAAPNAFSAAAAAPVETEAPVAASASSVAAAYPDDGSAAGEAEFVRPNTPLASRLVDKNWKVRADAFGELCGELEAASPSSASSLANTYTPYLAKLLADTNVVALEKALEVTKLVVEKHKDSMSLVEEVMPALLKKGMTGRASTLALSMEIIHSFIAIGGALGAVPVLSYLLTAAADAKQPKLQAASVTALKACLCQFGPKVIRLEELLGVWPTMLAASTPAVRKEAMELGCEMYRWLGPLFTQQMQACKLKDSQVAELETLFASITPGQAKPLRFTRADEAKMAKSGNKTVEAFDPLSLLAPVDICAKLSAGWNEFVTGNAKFAEKKEKLTELCTLAEGTPKILVSGATSEVCLSLNKLLKDSNLIVVSEALKCVAALAKGTRGDFALCARSMAPALFSLLKEKKTSVVKPAQDLLDALFVASDSLDSLWEHMSEGLNDKMSKLRLENVLFLYRCCQYEKAKSKINVATGKNAADMLYKLLADSDSEVREQALVTLAALMNVVGRKALSGVIGKLEISDAKKAQKLESMAAAAPNASGAASSSTASSSSVSMSNEEEKEVSVRPATSAGPRASLAPKKASISLTARPSTSAGISSLSSSSSASAASSSAGSNKLPTKSTTLKKASSASASSSSTSDVSVPVLSYEDATVLLNSHEAVGAEVVTLIVSKKWNETVEGLQKLQSQVCALPADQIPVVMPALFYFLIKTPSLKPSNVQVTKQIYECVRALSALQTPFPSSLCVLTLSDLFNKVSDKKFSDAITDVLLAYSEAVSPKLIVAEWIKVMDKENKNIKGVESAILAIPKLIAEFGVALFDVNALIDHSKNWATHVQKGIRDGGQAVLVAIAAQTGAMLKELILNGLKPSIAAALEAEFASLPPVPAAFEPPRSVRGQAAVSKINLDDVIPRSDISDKITEALLTKLNSDAWKERKEGMEEVHAILASCNHRISGKDGGLIETLKLRLVDNNKNLAKDALVLLSTLIADMGTPILKYASKLLPPLLTAVGDSKTFVKQEAIKALEQWVELSGLQALIKYMPKALDPTSQGRKELFELLAARLPNGPIKALDGVSKFDLSELVLPVLNACTDKAVDVRSPAEKVLEYVVANVGFDAVLEETKQLKKALVLQLMPSLEKFRYTTVGSLSSSSSTGADMNDDEPIRPATAPPKKSLVPGLAAKKSSISGSLTTRESIAPAPIAEEKKPSMLKARSRQSTLPSALKKPITAPAAAEVQSFDAEPIDESAGVSSGSSTLLKKLDLNAKRIRVGKDSKRVRGLYREYSKDEIEELDQQMYVLVVDDIYALLFHREFQKQVQALDVIEHELDSNYDAVASIADLLLKWSSWRMMDANTTLLAKILPFISKLFQAFEVNNYKLTDGEAANIFPSLVEKAFGHNTARFRTDTKELFGQCVSIFPVQKLFVFLVQGFESKNKRVQSECIEYVGQLLNKYGLVLCDRVKLLPQIGTMVGAGDAGVRTAALNALGNVYQVAGEEMFSLLGRGGKKEIIPQKQMQMIEERMRRIKAAGSATSAWGDESSVSSIPSATTAPSAIPSSIPAPAQSTPRKSIAPSGLLVRKKSGIAASPFGKARAQTMRPAQFAKAQAEYEAASHALNPEEQYEDMGGEGLIDEMEMIPPASTRTLVAHTPVKTPAAAAPPSHQRFHSNVADYSSPASLEAVNSNLPGCFSLELDPIIASHESGFELHDTSAIDASIPSSNQPAARSQLNSPAIGQTFGSPERMVDSAGGVAQSAFLSDTLIVLSEPSVPPEDRIEALHRMSELLSQQGKRAIIDNEEGVINVLMNELASSFTVYAATGLVTVNAQWNNAALASVQQLVSQRDLMAAMPQSLVEQLLSFLFMQLSDQRVLRSPACTELVNGCNQSILKALDALPRTRAFIVTIDLLRVAMLTPSRRGEVELVAKCLAKLHKALVRDGASGLDLKELLRALQRFTDVISPADTTHDNGAMKALLSVIHELVALEPIGCRSGVSSMPATCVLSQYVSQLLGPASSPQASPQQSPSQTSPAASAASGLAAPKRTMIQIHASPKSSGIPAPTSVSPTAAAAPSATTPPSKLRAPVVTASPAGSPSSYREQLEALKSKASLATAPSLLSPTVASLDEPANPTSPAAVPQPRTLEQIRARFKSLNPSSMKADQENKPVANAQPLAAMPQSGITKPTATVDATQPAAAAPGSSSLLALRAKVAAMNRKA